MKPVIVLLRGLFREQRHWGEFTQLLQQSQSGCDVIAIDTLGNGQVAHRRSPLDIETYADHIMAELASYQGRPIILIGLSLGGMIALACPHRGTLPLQHIIAINSSCNMSPWYQRFHIEKVLMGLWQAWRWRERDQDTSLIEAAILRFTTLSQHRNQRLLQRWSQYRKQNRAPISHLIRQLYAALRFTFVPSDNVTVSFIAASQDQLVNPECSQNMAKRQGSQVHFIEAAGHDAGLDQPQALCQVIAGILQCPEYRQPP
ncbi:alpha/beta fold hydrolase [Motilimonas pumila]|nr:alpha/beta hydrolase [Motilimonas pumila]